MSVITLITDFGTRDWFVGTMKGVILGLAPKANLVDITHEIMPGDIQSGAFALAASFGFFPRGTVHLAVVDPGVGSSRAAMIAETEDYLFVGPDNGLLSLALERQNVKSMRLIENPKLALKSISRTFHGRDVFAPAAAYLSCGLAPRKFGPKLRDCERLKLPLPKEKGGRWSGVILYIDRFGNAITNLPEDLPLLGHPQSTRLRLLEKRRTSVPVAQFYQAVPRGEALALVGSSGLLEIAINGGNAAQGIKLRPGDPVELVRTQADATRTGRS